MSRSQVATDSFTYSDGALETVSSSAWVSLNPGSATPSVTSNKYSTPHSSHAVARWAGGSWTADQYATLAVSGLGNTNNICGVVVRASADLNGNRDYYAAWVEDSSLTASLRRTVIAKVVNGTITELSSVTGDTWNDGDVIELEVVGSTLSVFKNGGAELRNVTDTDLPGATTDRAGVIALGGTIRGDDWVGGNITSGGGGLPAGAESAYLPGGMQPQTSPLTISKW